MHVAQFVALAILTLGPVSAFSQSPAAPTAQPADTQITLNVVAAHRSGNPIAGLTQQDFTILDNNVPQQVTGFKALGPESPTDILLVVDAVNTTFINLGYERGQIDNFLKANDGHLAHPISIAIFTDTGTQVQRAPSTDGNQLAASLDQSVVALRNITRDSQDELSDRINISLAALQSVIAREASRPGHKLIFWVSPGWPLLSGPRINLDYKQQQRIYSQIIGISTMLRRNDITLYAVDPIGAGQSVEWEYGFQEYVAGLTKPGKAELGDLALQVIAVQSGGIATSSSNDIAHSIQQCMDDTTAYYRITYAQPPAEKTNEYHAISVKVAAPGVTARTRTGYYANPSLETP